MSPSNSGVKRGHIATDILRSTVSYVKTGAWEYIQESVPTTISTVRGMRDDAKSLASALKNTAQSILPAKSEMKRQPSIRSILSWYTEKEDEYGSDVANELDYDVQGGSDETSSIVEEQISDADRNTDKLRKSFVESTHRLAEINVDVGANIISKIDKATTAITSGFKSTNDLLERILEVVTKNTSTIVETTAAAVGAIASSNNPANDMLKSNSFDFKKYKNVVKDNFAGTGFGMISQSVISALDMIGITDMMKGGAKPNARDVIPVLFNMGMDHLFPNLKKNLQTLDKSLSEEIFTSLVKLGSSKNERGAKGFLARLFGIDSYRENVDTSRSKLEIKSTPFDTITKEAITNTIPGYLQRILVQLGGDNVIYDYRSRSFRTSTEVKREFRHEAARTDELSRADKKIQKALGSDDHTRMVYDMLITSLGDISAAEYNGKIQSFANKKNLIKYLENDVFGGYDLDKYQRGAIRRFAKQFNNVIRDGGERQIFKQVTTSNANRRERAASLAAEYDRYNIDISDVKDSTRDELDARAEMYGIKKKPSGAFSEIAVTGHNGTSSLTGTDYTNMALYEIYRRLDKGINVFQTGSKHNRDNQYKKMGSRFLKPPAGYNAKSDDTDEADGLRGKALLRTMQRDAADEKNLLENQELDDGSTEDLSRGERIGRWAKHRGKGLWNALIHGNSDDVKSAFGAIVSDVAQVGGDQLKKSMAKINQSFGNITGFIKHKIFGTEYEYQDGVDEKGNPIMKKIAKNEKGGMFGFMKDYIGSMFKGTKDKAKNWVKGVADMFDFGDKNNPEGQQVAGKRKKFISTAVGALGGGILAGPLGIIMGSLAGNALSFTGIGNKIHDLLFGRYTNGRKKGKAKGILTQLGDAIISPIRYHIGKTVESVGRGLKKNIFGPLSNLGHAIKDRITNAAEHHFGKFFGGIIKVLMSPFKAIKNLGKGAITLGGNLVRGAFGMGSWVTGRMINSFARSIGGRTTHTNADGTTMKFGDFIKQQNKKFADEADKSRKNSKYSSYKKWKEEDQKRHAEMMEKYNSYIQEKEEEIKDNTEDIKKATEKVDENTSKATNILEGETVTGNSFKTHDQGVHDRLDVIIKLMGGEPLGKKTNAIPKPGDPGTAPPPEPNKAAIDQATKAAEEDEEEGFFSSIKNKAKGAASGVISKVKGWFSKSDDGFATSAMNVAATIASQDGVDDDDIRLSSDVIDKASSDSPDKRGIVSRIKSLFSRNKKKSEKSEEKKTSLWDTITGLFSGITSNLPLIATAAAGLWMLFNNPEGLGNIIKGIGTVVGGIFNVIGNLGGTIGSFLGGISNPSTTQGDAITAGANVGAGLIDVSANGVGDYYLPGNTLSHVQTNANGQSIANAAANEVKNFTFKQDAISYIATGESFKQHTYMNAANKYYDKSLKQFDSAQALQAKAESVGGLQGKIYEKAANGKLTSAQKNLDKAEAAGEQGLSASNSGLGTIGHAVTKAGVHWGMSSAAGGIASTVAGWGGADEQTAAVVGNTASGIASAALTVNNLTKGDKSIVNKGANLIESLLKKGFDWLSKKFASDGKFATFASRITSWFSKIKDFSLKGLTEKLITKALQKLGISSAAAIASAATAGITVVAGALSGLASGLCGVEHLFGVLPGQADAGMTTISAVMGTIFGALEMSPVAPFVMLIDIIDMIVQPFLGMGLKQGIARLLYTCIGGEGAAANLEEKQQAFEAERQRYADTYGKDLDSATYNDMINNTGWVDALIGGKTRMSEDGQVQYSETGNVLTNGGIKNAWFGQEDVAARDENGELIRDAEGNILSAKDKYGNVIKKDMKRGDYFMQGLGAIGRFFTGGTEYETDENGNAKYDEEGNLIVKKEGKNIFQRWGEGVKEGWSKVFGKDADKDKGFFGRMADGVGSFFKNFLGIADDVEEAADEAQNESSYVMNDDGTPFIDGGGKRVLIKDLPNYVTSAMNKAQGAFITAATEISDIIDEEEKSKYELDKDGNPLKLVEYDKDTGVATETLIKKGELTKYWKEGLKLIDGYVTDPLNDAIEAGEGYQNGEISPWKKLGYSSAYEYYKAKFGSVSDKISTAIDTITSNINAGLEDGLSVAEAEAISSGIRYVSEQIAEQGGFSDVSDPQVISQTMSMVSGLNPTGPYTPEQLIQSFEKSGMIIEAFSKQGEDDEESEGGEGPSSGGQGGARNVYEDQANEGMISSVKSSSTAEPGGNPLNKAFDVTSSYGRRSAPFSGFHQGVDLVPQDGSKQADVGSKFNGKVSEVKTTVSETDTAWKDSSGTWHYDGNNSMGNYVKIITDDGYQITNMHLKPGSIPTSIRAGATVKIGDKIGEMGSTGWSTGPHLHYQIDNLNAKSDGEKGQSVNPSTYMYGIYSDDETGQFRATSGTNYPANESGSFFSNGEYNNTIGSFGDFFKAIGNNFMRGITGGLFGINTNGDYSFDSGTISSRGWVTTGDNDTVYNLTNEEMADAYLRAREQYRTASSKDGTSITIPDGYGTYEAWEPEMVGAGYNKSNWESKRNHPTHGWSTQSFQGLLRRHAIANGRYKGQKIYGVDNAATIDDRILIATNHNIGDNMPVLSGDMVDVKFTDGSVWPAMIADAKSQEGLAYDSDITKWGHDGGKNTVELIYDSDPTTNGGSGNIQKRVKSITKVGEYNPSKRSPKPVIVNTENGEEVATDGGGAKGGSKISANPVHRPRKVNKGGIGGPESSFTLSGNSYHPAAPVQNTTTDNASKSSNELISLIYQLLYELRLIRQNTGESSDLLESINEKDFIDNELRELLTSSQKVPTTSGGTRRSSSVRPSGSARNILAMARA